MSAIMTFVKPMADFVTGRRGDYTAEHMIKGGRALIMHIIIEREHQCMLALTTNQPFIKTEPAVSNCVQTLS